MFLLSVLIISCDNDGDNEVFEPKGDYENGLLISGEGSFGGTSGSVSFISNDFSTVEHQIYNNVNTGKELGRYVQSITFDNENAYICVDTQNSITVVNRYTFAENGVISEGLVSPRYMTIVNGKGYATNWGTSTWGNIIDDAFIAVINLATLTVERTIPVSVGPERIIEKNGKLYVSHKGGLGKNNIISVIEINNDEKSEIIVKEKPDELFFDNQNNLVVLCEGDKYSASEVVPASIIKIDTNLKEVILDLEFPTGDYPELLEQNGNFIYYNVNSNIYRIEHSSTELSANSFIETDAVTPYGMAVKQDGLFLLDVGDYSGQSTLNVYDLTTQTSNFTSKVAVIASKIYFN